MSRPNEPSRPDLYTRITHQIVAQLEAGVRPWSQPWAASESVSRPLRHDGTPYRGVNVVLLWGEAAARGFQSSTWMTFRQALENYYLIPQADPNTASHTQRMMKTMALIQLAQAPE